MNDEIWRAIASNHIEAPPVDGPPIPVCLPNGETISPDIKQELDIDNPSTSYASKGTHVYKCKFKECQMMFQSCYQFHVHINSHAARCLNCKVLYASWKALERHEIYCPRRFGRVMLPPRPSTKVKEEPKLPHACSLCERKFRKYQELYDHQVNHCDRRYITDDYRWIVKI